MKILGIWTWSILFNPIKFGCSQIRTIFSPIETLLLFYSMSASVCATRVCDCFYRGWHSGNIITWQLPMCPLRLIHWPWIRGLAQERRLSIKLEVSRRWPEADSFPICKLSVFIYLLLKDLRFKPKGHFFFLLWKNNHAVIFPADHSSLAHHSQGLE